MLLAIALALTSATTSFDVSGVRVILRQNDANNVVAANLYMLGGARQVTAANAGIEYTPRFLMYNPMNAWGRKREVPAAPATTFREWYLKNRGKA